MSGALPAAATEAACAAQPSEVESAHGEVFTQRWVVDLILDLVGYTPDRDLAQAIALEPSCGGGAFVVPMVERLLASANGHARTLDDLRGSLVAIDLLPANVEASRQAVIEALTRTAAPVQDAEMLAETWVRRGDFLLDPPPERSVDFAVGNPPYIRLEAVPRKRSQAYRESCGTMGGRADVYVGFYEHALRSLTDEGVLGFICADRWMRNAYGARLRQMICEGWSVESVTSLTGVDAFEHEVDAYPAITILRRGSQARNPAVVEATTGFGPGDAKKVFAFLDSKRSRRRSGPRHRAVRLKGWYPGCNGWPNGTPDQLALIAGIEASFPTLEEAGTKVGIGVATGADKIYVTDSPDQIEPARLLPLALPRDIVSGCVDWSGKVLVNPWDSDGLVDLDEWPQLARYLKRHRSTLKTRHTARNGHWHRTIDRVIEGLAEKPKLYLPDFKERTFPVLDKGQTYPHHNLYWITSESWDLDVLGGLLLSEIANLFMEAYSVRMRGGFLRFQAQYLRRIRVPHPDSIPNDAASTLKQAFCRRDSDAATEVALELYGLSGLPAHG